MQLFSDYLHRMAYATDASAYRQLPAAVAYPENEQDIRDLIFMARERHTCLIPRGAGTSVAGQVVGDGIVVDVSRHLCRILEINPEERWARVQSGVVRDELNIALKPYGLFFSPQTSTSNRCCIGGMVGNNSCGANSLIYGSTRHHVLQLKGFLSDGSYFDTAQRGDSPLEKSIYAQLEGWAADPAVRGIIRDNFPDPQLRRRSCGYAIDEALGILPGSNPSGGDSFGDSPSGGNSSGDNSFGDSPSGGNTVDLAKILTGSEGTLAFITEIKVSLDELEPEQTMVLAAHCSSLEDCFEANLVALGHGPVAVELMDGKILSLSRDNISASRNRFFVRGDPAGLLLVQFSGPDRELRADALEKELLHKKLSYTCTRVYDGDVPRVWALRKAGLGVLSGMKGDAKPVGVIEDTAVAPHRLPAYMADFRKMLDALELDCVYYGHIGTGELHLRPIINLKTAQGRAKFRQVAEQTARLVRAHKGSLSGEHGDGRLRGEFIPLMYGQQCYELMRSLKQCWDPFGVFNMNKIVDTPGMDEFLRFNVPHSYSLCSQIGADDTYFNWRADFDGCKTQGASGVSSQTHALMCSIEQCNGAGDCRRSKLLGGTMCPAFRHSSDELDSTRARANVLRECLTFGEGLDSPQVKRMLDSCLSCKACRSECPSNVDMSRIKAELLQQIYDRHGMPLRSFAVAHMSDVERFGSRIAPLYNFLAAWGPSSALIKKAVGFAPQRSIPKVHDASAFVKKYASRRTNPSRHGSRGRVYFFLDEFIRYNEPEIAREFVSLLGRLGYEVVIPGHCESGRAAISKGCLRMAKDLARRNVLALSDIVNDRSPLVGLEPSCILNFRDEYPDLVPADMRSKALSLSANCLLYDEFIQREVRSGRIGPDDFQQADLDIWLHGHCHQKALVGIEKTARSLELIRGARVHVIPSQCCGMAGSFGYESEHYRTSLEIGEMVLFPAVRKAVRAAESSERIAIVAAPGVSCRQQILDGTGVKAVHPVCILNRFVVAGESAQGK